MVHASRAYTYEKLREDGWLYRVEQFFNRWSNKSNDMFGMWDVFAMHPKTFEWKGIQICAFGEETKHIEKINQATWVFEDVGVGVQLLPVWKACGGGAELWSWGKLCRAGRGTRKEWKCRITIL